MFPSCEQFVLYSLPRQSVSSLTRGRIQRKCQRVPILEPSGLWRGFNRVPWVPSVSLNLYSGYPRGFFFIGAETDLNKNQAFFLFIPPGAQRVASPECSRNPLTQRVPSPLFDAQRVKLDFRILSYPALQFVSKS